MKMPIEIYLFNYYICYFYVRLFFLTLQLASMQIVSDVALAHIDALHYIDKCVSHSIIVVAQSKGKLLAMLPVVRALLEAELWGLLKLES